MRRIYGMSLLFMMVTALAFAHGGGLDANGGHRNRKTGDYHYHRQPVAKTQASDQSSAKSFKNDTPNKSQTVEKAFWINSSSGVRHNNKCRHFGNTKNGKYCGANEGRPCRICGG